MSLSDGLPFARTVIEKAKSNMTETEMREWKALDKQTSQLWRNFWVRVLKRRGMSNAAIAKEFELSESTVRHILKGAK